MAGNSSVTPQSSTAESAGGARIMITNGGTHPPDFWAQVTAEQICPISPTVTGRRRLAALELQAKICIALEPHHARVQENEKSKLAADAGHHLLAVEPEAHAGEDADKAMVDIAAAAVGTEWQDHLTFGQSKPDWLDAHLKNVDERGADADPLTAVQQAQLDSWNRQNLIRSEIVRHFATAQHIERSWHGDRLKAGV